MTLRLRHFFFLTALLACAGVQAQTKPIEDPLETDRPDFTESPETVGKGRLHIETGIHAERNNGGDERSLVTPTLIRIGVAEDVELRFETDGRREDRVRSAGPTVVTKGYSDLSIGVKWHFIEGEGIVPSTGVLLHVDLDSGSSAFRGNGKRPSLRFAHSWDLDKNVSLSMMEGVVWDRTDSGERFINSVFSLSLGTSWNDRFRSFVEFAAPQIARTKFGGTQTSFNVGGSYFLTKDMQVDLYLNKGMSKYAPDLAGGMGFSIRF